MLNMDIDDVIQEMYARLVSQPSLESIKYPRQYAVQTATAIIIDDIRRARVVSITAAGSLDQLEILSPEASAEEQLAFRGEIAQVARSLAQMPERTREILILRRVEGLSQQQTAQKLGVSVKTVEKHMTIGIAALMAAFGRGGKSSSCASTDMRTHAHETNKITSGD